MPMAICLALLGLPATASPLWALIPGYAHPGVYDLATDSFTQRTAKVKEAPHWAFTPEYAPPSPRKGAISLRLRSRRAVRGAGLPETAGSESTPAGNESTREPLSILFLVDSGREPQASQKAQESWIQHVRRPQKALFTCGENCREDPSLKSVVIVPNLMRGKASGQPEDDRQASMRAPWALQWVYKLISKTGSGSKGVNVDKDGAAEKAGVPEGYGYRLATEQYDWYLIGDSDTFVNVPVLERYLAQFDPNKNLVVHLDGRRGPGIAVSKKAAGLFAQKFWSDYWPKNRDTPHIDGTKPSAFVGFLTRDVGAKAVSPQGVFSESPPSGDQLKSGMYRYRVATWHNAWNKHGPTDYEKHIYGTGSNAALEQEKVEAEKFWAEVEAKNKV